MKMPEKCGQVMSDEIQLNANEERKSAVRITAKQKGVIQFYMQHAISCRFYEYLID